MTATAESSNKRPRSLSGDLVPPAAKSAKTHSNHLQINYLARQYNDNIPLVNVDDTLPSILHLIQEYEGVLHRHESIAGNLGACPLGPILIKRFERLFDGPPRVLKSHGKEGTTVSWLDVVDFARNKPEQFNLEKMRNGIRVCQFYTKQSRVEISEEDYVLIASGMPQKLIPPQPIEEDEEKELGALEILEKNLMHIVQLADQGKAIRRMTVKCHMLTYLQFPQELDSSSTVSIIEKLLSSPAERVKPQATRQLSGHRVLQHIENIRTELQTQPNSNARTAALTHHTLRSVASRLSMFGSLPLLKVCQIWLSTHLLARRRSSQLLIPIM